MLLPIRNPCARSSSRGYLLYCFSEGLEAGQVVTHGILAVSSYFNDDQFVRLGIEGGYRVIVNLEHPVSRPKITGKLPIDVKFAVHSNQTCRFLGSELVVC